MSAKDNKAIIRRYVDTWNRGDLDALFTFWSPDIVHHTRSASYGFDETKRLVTDFTMMFAGMRFQVEDMIAERDRVVSRMTWRATHDGGFLGGAPTRKEISCAVLGVARLRNGAIVEHWGVTDELHMMQQMGLVPDELLLALEYPQRGPWNAASAASTVPG
jgi:C-1 hydroxylase